MSRFCIRYASDGGAWFDSFEEVQSWLIDSQKAPVDQRIDLHEVVVFSMCGEEFFLHRIEYVIWANQQLEITWLEPKPSSREEVNAKEEELIRRENEGLPYKVISYADGDGEDMGDFDSLQEVKDYLVDGLTMSHPLFEIDDVVIQHHRKDGLWIVPVYKDIFFGEEHEYEEEDDEWEDDGLA